MVLQSTTPSLSTSGLVIFDPAFRIVEWSPSQTTLTGFTRVEMVAKTLWEYQLAILPPELKTPEQLALFKAQLTGSGRPAWLDRPQIQEIQAKNGARKPVRIASFPIELSGQRLYALITQDISVERKLEAQFKAAFDKLNALWRITSLTTTDLKTISDYILETIVTMTGSEYGFYGFINNDENIMTIHSWSGEAMKDCGMVDKPQHFPIHAAGMWAEAVRRREPLICNRYEDAHAPKKGLPAGHVALSKLLVVPYFSGGRITAVAAVANRAEDYTVDDVTQVITFLTSIHALVNSIRAEQALQKSEALLNETQRLARVGGWEWDVALQTMAWSAETYRLHGFSLEEIQSGSPEHIRRSLECYDPADRPKIQAAFEECIASGKPYDMEMPFTTLQGERKWIQTMGRATFENGKVVRVTGNIIDITERKQAYEALAQEKLKAQNYLDIADVVLIAIDPDETVSLLNKKGCQVLGYSEGELIGQNWFDRCIPTDIRETTRKVFQQIMARQAAGIEYYENPVVTRTGEERLVGWHNTLIQAPDGRILGTLSSGEDITERKKVETKINEQIDELRRWHKITLGREARILELKREVNQLLAESGRPPRYGSVTEPRDE